ncbi:hypothetical protein [Bifidobacterium callimiconis]|nr:hypothetical protein [Bifidobacterium callimiconis]
MNMDMDDRRFRRRVVLLAVGAVVVFGVLIGMAAGGSTFEETFGRHDASPSATASVSPSSSASRTAEASPNPSVSTSAEVRGVEADGAAGACDAMAADAVRAFVTDSPDRDAALHRLFTDDAQGLSTPVSALAGQDADVDYGTGLMDGSASTAVCSVWNGGESPWIVSLRVQDTGRWMATGIQGPYDQYVMENPDDAADR